MKKNRLIIYILILFAFLFVCVENAYAETTLIKCEYKLSKNFYKQIPSDQRNKFLTDKIYVIKTAEGKILYEVEDKYPIGGYFVNDNEYGMQPDTSNSKDSRLLYEFNDDNQNLFECYDTKNCCPDIYFEYYNLEAIKISTQKTGNSIQGILAGAVNGQGQELSDTKTTSTESKKSNEFGNTSSLPICGETSTYGDGTEWLQANCQSIVSEYRNQLDEWTNYFLPTNGDNDAYEKFIKDYNNKKIKLTMMATKKIEEKIQNSSMPCRPSNAVINDFIDSYFQKAIEKQENQVQSNIENSTQLTDSERQNLTNYSNTQSQTTREKIYKQVSSELNNWMDNLTKELSDSTCQAIIDEYLLTKIEKYIGWIQIAVPILIIVLGSVDFSKAVLFQEKEDLNKAFNTFIKRCIVGVAIFFVPLIIKYLVKVLDTYGKVHLVECLKMIFK